MPTIEASPPAQMMRFINLIGFIVSLYSPPGPKWFKNSLNEVKQSEIPRAPKGAPKPRTPAGVQTAARGKCRRKAATPGRSSSRAIPSPHPMGRRWRAAPDEGFPSLKTLQVENCCATEHPQLASRRNLEGVLEHPVNFGAAKWASPQKSEL